MEKKNATVSETFGLPDDSEIIEAKNPVPGGNLTSEAFAELFRGVHLALESYSNVHRGSGHNSMVSTSLFEQARDIVLEYLGLHRGKYVVVFCTPRSAQALKSRLDLNSYQCVSGKDTGLPLGVWALAVKSKSLPGGIPFQTGGGTARLVSPGWVIWASVPGRFEAGTPAIVNIIAFAKALRVMRDFGNDVFLNATTGKLTANEILYNDGPEKLTEHELLADLRHTLIGRGVLVPTVEGLRPYINLDNGASTPTFRPVWDAVCKTWRQPLQVQQEVIHEVREICAGFLGAPLTSYDIVFTSNTTEAINITAGSLGNKQEPDIEPVVLNTFLEHNSNDLPWRMVPGFSLIRLPVDDEGFVDLNMMESLLSAYNQKGQHGKKRIRLVAVSGASNVLGVFNDLEAISRIAHRYGAHLLVDAAQLVAHRKVDVEGCGIDYLAFSAHKVYAPFGSGVLVVRKGLLDFKPEELNAIKSSGEENAGGIAALGKALLLLQQIGMDLIQEEEQALTSRLLHGMAQIPGLVIYGIKDPDSPRFDQKGGVVVFALKSVMPDRVARELAERAGIGVRYGCHCAHLLIKRLLKIGPALERMQALIVTMFPRVNLPGLARISLGIENSEADVDTLIRVLENIARQPSLPKSDIKERISDFVKVVTQGVYLKH